MSTKAKNVTLLAPPSQLAVRLVHKLVSSVRLLEHLDPDWHFRDQVLLQLNSDSDSSQLMCYQPCKRIALIWPKQFEYATLTEDRRVRLPYKQLPMDVSSRLLPQVSLRFPPRCRWSHMQSEACFKPPPEDTGGRRETARTTGEREPEPEPEPETM